MLDALRLYGRYVGISFRSQMQYRASFIMQTLGQFVISIIEFLAIWALFHRFGSLAGWTLPEVGFLYGIVNTIWAVTDAVSRGFDIFGNTVRLGEFDRVLLRPRSTVLQLAGQEFTLRRVGRFAQGFAVLLWAIHALDIAWSVGKLVLLIEAFLGGCCLFYGLLIIQATTCFWTTETIEIMNVFTYGGVETARYPMSIYGRNFRRIFTYVIPLASVTYFPSLVILNKTDPLGFPAWFSWISPSLGVAFLAVSLFIWRFGVRHYQSTGS